MNEITADLRTLQTKARNIIAVARDEGRDLTDAEASRVDSILKELETGLEIKAHDLAERLREVRE